MPQVLYRCPKCGLKQLALNKALVMHRCTKAKNRMIEFEEVAPDAVGKA